MTIINIIVFLVSWIIIQWYDHYDLPYFFENNKQKPSIDRQSNEISGTFSHLAPL